MSWKMGTDEKAWLYTFALVLVGWVLARVPIINLVLALFVLICTVIVLYAMVHTALEKKEEKKGKK